jgi:hypothetical protein
VAAWAALAASTPLAKVQNEYLKPPGVLQVAVPVMGLVGCFVIRELGTRRAGADIPHPEMASG